jgi:HEAT repeat protein
MYEPLSDHVLTVVDRALHDQDQRVRTAAINALRTAGAHDPQKVIPLLKQAAATEKNGATKRMIESVLESLEASPKKSNTNR